MGNAESGFYFGYAYPPTSGDVSPEFGIIYQTNGIQPVVILKIKDILAPAVSITLNGIQQLVYVVQGNTFISAYLISQATYNGWDAQSDGDTVTFVYALATVIDNLNEFSITNAGNSSFTITQSGNLPTTEFISRIEWNGTKVNGIGENGFNLNPSLGNVYQINIQYLGFGSISFQLENNKEIVTVHTIIFPNTRTTITTSQPTYSYILSVQPTSALTFTCILSARNDLLFAGRTNQKHYTFTSLNMSAKHSQPVKFYILKNATLNNPSFNSLSANYPISTDIQSKSCTISDNIQIIWCGSVYSDVLSVNLLELEDFIEPGDIITVAAKVSLGIATYAFATLLLL